MKRYQTMVLLLLGLALAAIPRPARAAGATAVPVASVSWLIGLTTHGSTGLVAAYNYPYGTPNNLCSIAGAGNVTPAAFSSLSGFTRKPAIAEAPPEATAYRPGSIYVTDDDWSTPTNPYLGAPYRNRRIYRVSADGSTVEKFATMPTTWPVGAIAFDTTGNWANLLYVATEDGSVYVVLPGGQVAYLTTVGPIDWPHVFIVSMAIFRQDASLGPLSGTIALARQANYGAPGAGVSAVSFSAGGLTVADVETGLEAPQTLALIPGGQNCYLSAYGRGTIYGVSAADMAPYAGKILVGVGKDPEDCGIWAIAWNGTSFDVKPIVLIPRTTLVGVAFTKAGVGPLPAAP